MKLLSLLTLILMQTPAFAANTQLDVNCKLEPQFENSNRFSGIEEADVYYDTMLEEYVLEAKGPSLAKSLTYTLNQIHHNNTHLSAVDESTDSSLQATLNGNKQLIGTVVLEKDFAFSAVCEGDADLNSSQF
jgi:hypothetical protein